MGSNTVHYNTFPLSATQDVPSFFFPSEFGEAGINQAGLALFVRSARPFFGYLARRSMVPPPFVGYGSWIGWWLWHGEFFRVCVPG